MNDCAVAQFITPKDLSQPCTIGAAWMSVAIVATIVSQNPIVATRLDASVALLEAASNRSTASVVRPSAATRAFSNSRIAADVSSDAWRLALPMLECGSNWLPLAIRVADWKSACSSSSRVGRIVGCSIAPKSTRSADQCPRNTAQISTATSATVAAPSKNVPNASHFVHFANARPVSPLSVASPSMLFASAFSKLFIDVRMLSVLALIWWLALSTECCTVCADRLILAASSCATRIWRIAPSLVSTPSPCAPGAPTASNFLNCSSNAAFAFRSSISGSIVALKADSSRGRRGPT